MAVSSTRSVQLVNSGDVAGTNTVAAATNTTAPGQISILTLATGSNTVTVPGGGTVPTAVTIVPPTGNTNLITVKGVSGDTGIALHNTDPSSIALDSTVTTFVLNAASTITGVRLFWS